jgi:hypothetical protein
MTVDHLPDTQEQASDRTLTAEGGAESVPAWEQIEPGRFMPRRIRGSYRGGKLG